MFSKLSKFFTQHKFIGTVIILAIAYGGYWEYKNLTTAPAQTKYIVTEVLRGTIASTIAGTGQVSASNQVDVKPKVSGDIVIMNAVNGKEVKTGELLAQLDSRDAQKSVRDMESSLATAKLSFEKFKRPADALSLLQAENSLISARNSLDKLKITQVSDYQDGVNALQEAKDNLTKAYDDGFNSVANAFLDLSTVMTGLNDVLYGTTLSVDKWNIEYYADVVKNYDEKVLTYKQTASDSYATARASYDKNFTDYKAASRFSDVSIIESLISETYETTKSIAEAIKNANTLIQFYTDQLSERNLRPNSLSTTHLSSLNSYTSKTNSHLLSLLSNKSSLQSDKDAITAAEKNLTDMARNNPLDLAAAERTLQEREESLKKIKAGPDALDIQSQELSLKQKENALADAREKLADYFIRAPFDGVLTGVTLSKGNPASASTIIATIITKQRIATISLNEVDVAKVKLTQKTTLTFDAVPDLSVTGQVAEIGAIGTVSQGVVSYSVKITFDTQDERVKPGMSVSASIITDIKQDILSVPNGAIKSQGNSYYVEMPNEKITLDSQNNQGIILPLPLKQKTVEIGIANDTNTEIISGLNEGDQIVTRTIAAQSSTPAATAPSLFGGGGMRVGR